MAKSDARFEYRANLNRESHDLSYPFGFTAAPGMLLPVFADLATPKDTYYIEHDLEYLRTLPMLAPAMVDVKIHFESFFVPFQMIYQPVEQTLYSLTDFQSSMFNQGSAQNTNFPLFDNVNMRDGIMSTAYNHSKEHADMFRLYDMLGMNADSVAYDGSNPSRCAWSPYFFPWQLLAYHTIFNYFYRLDDKDPFRAAESNWDFYYASTSPVGNSTNMVMIHQRPWDFDYFTSLYRSPIVSSLNTQTVIASGQYSNLLGSYTLRISDAGSQTGVNSDVRAFAPNFPATYNNNTANLNVSTAAIRQMFANEKLAMITGRARKTYDAQVLAHFGAEVPHDPKHDIAFIGRDTYMLKVGEVTSLASTSGAGLGDLAGKGWANGKGRKHKFVAPCHGVVMTIFSVEPLKRYYGGFDRINSLTNTFDIPQPEFDRLGNVPMFRYETGENAGSGVVQLTDIVGWKERYYWNKRRHPKVTLAFMNAAVTRGYNEYGSYMLTSAPFGAYTSTNNNTARPDLVERFYIDRNCMDGLMFEPFVNAWQTGATGEETTENWNATPWLSYRRDPFIVDLNLKVQKVSWMSKDGEPIYNF